MIQTNNLEGTGSVANMVIADTHVLHYGQLAISVAQVQRHIWVYTYEDGSQIKVDCVNNVIKVVR